MKKTIIWVLAILILIVGGGIYLHRTSSRPQNTATPTVKVKPKKKKIHPQPAKQSSISNSTTTYNKENKTKSSSSSSSSAAASSSSSNQASQSSSSSMNTGTAGKQGAGKMGDHTVNGQTVGNNTLAQIKQQLSNLGYDANAWSPQDMINLYRSVNQNGTKTPAQITKNDVENYLHK